MMESRMADIDHIGNLKKLRGALVEKRRSMALTSIEIALANKDDLPSVSWAKAIADTQSLIEALDESIKDEEKIKGPRVSSMPLPI
jgi:hypothetical protein